MTTAPARTLDQRLAALEEANRRRSLRAQRKALWRAGTKDEAVADFWDLLDSPPEWASSWRVYEALLALPNLGPVGAHNFVRRTGMSLVKTLGGLTTRQRHELAAALRKWADPREHGCVDCGEPAWRPGTRCERCHRAMLASKAAPRRTCPDCDGLKDPTSIRCAHCERARRRAAACATVCPDCGGYKSGSKSAKCWRCRFPASTAYRNAPFPASGSAQERF